MRFVVRVLVLNGVGESKPKTAWGKRLTLTLEKVKKFPAFLNVRADASLCPSDIIFVYILFEVTLPKLQVVSGWEGREAGDKSN